MSTCDRLHVSSGRYYKREILTSRVWVDLPVLVEWPTRCKNDDEACQERANDKREPDPNWNAIAVTKAILRMSVTSRKIQWSYWSSYSESDVECHHGQFQGPDQSHISRPARNLDFRANHSIALVLASTTLYWSTEV